MKTMLNWIIIAGRLTRDPELRYTQSNTAVASFTLAVDRDYSGGKDAGKQTDFIDVVAWRHDADSAAKYFRKGLMALVSGRLQSRKWQTKDGANRTAWEIQADHLYFAERREQSPPPIAVSADDFSEAPGTGEENPFVSPAAQSSFAGLSEEEGELPF